MAKDKINEATTVASSRSRGGNKKEDKTKQQHGTARELPKWAENMPEYITVKTWDLD
jgi:hypothetical protein